MRSYLRRLLLLTLVLVALLPAAVAHAMTDSGVTLNKDSGGQPARFNLTAVTDKDAAIDSMVFRFPPGFDLSKSHATVTTLKGLQRTIVHVTEKRAGQEYSLSFQPPIAPESNLSLYVYDVGLPTDGGDFKLDATYIAKGETRTIPDLTFSFATRSVWQEIANSLENQAWVKAWNSVGFLDLFMNPQQAILALPLVFRGWLSSVALVAVAFPIAITLGLMLAFIKMSKIPPVRWPANVYVNVIRGTPLFLQIYIAFVGLPIAGLRAPWFPTSVIVLALNSSAYLAEIFRAGIQSINKGQFEASSSLGMSYAQSMRYVIVPQTVKRVLPTMTSEFILLFKDTALLFAVGVFELMMYANSRVANTGNLTPFMVGAVFYLIVTIPLINWVARLEARLAVSEGGQSASEQSGSFLTRMFGRVRPTVDETAELAPVSERR
jgi:polar amino acid transport system substrate-binding protein